MKTIQGIENAKDIINQIRDFRIDDLPSNVRKTICRIFGKDLTPSEVVKVILEKVYSEGDQALTELGYKIDNIHIKAFEIDNQTIKNAYKDISTELVDALKYSAQRITDYHLKTVPKSWYDSKEGYGQRIVPVQKVGIYVPGGTAPYPSTVLMTAIPARVAGVNEVILTTPPNQDSKPNSSILVAADIAGVDRIFQVGGAQAIGAMAYGTKSIPKMDMVCGPGNIFVTLAKKQLYGYIGIDGLYGPTETIVVADETSNHILCAADLLAQAEHDTMATPILITTSLDFAKAVLIEIETQLNDLERKAIAETSLNKRGHIFVVEHDTEVVEIINLFAPEHVSLLNNNPDSILELINNAGGIFIGDFSPEVVGDYTAGPSHTMPTGGTARFNSALGIHNFIKFMPIVRLNYQAMQEQGPVIDIIGRAEGFTAHAKAANLRLKKQP